MDLHLAGKAQFCGIEVGKLMIDERSVSLVIGRKAVAMYIWQVLTAREKFFVQ